MGDFQGNWLKLRLYLEGEGTESVSEGNETTFNPSTYLFFLFQAPVWGLIS